MSSNTVTCECGCSLLKSSMNRHLKSIKHQRLILKKQRENDERVMCTCSKFIWKNEFKTQISSDEHSHHKFKIASMEKIQEDIAELFENQEQMTDSEYIKKNNRYLEEFKLCKRLERVFIEVIHICEYGIFKLHQDASKKVIIWHYW